MCGIAGFIGNRAGGSEGVLTAMLDAIVHRGPDDAGAWDDGNVHLGHRRLSIIDLSACGHQPMLSNSGRYVLSYNGEIYNHLKLRGDLEQCGVAFKGHSDTEVLIALIERDGLAGALVQCVGMFALALWDRRDRVLSLARDRVGEKPLYYGSARGVFLFASELKALQVHPAFDGEVDPASVEQIVARGYVDADRSIYRHFAQVGPGCVVSFEPDAGPGHTTTSYWSAEQVARAAAAHPFGGSYGQACDRLDMLLGSAVSLQLNADVPVGAFLSGGVDSSLVAAMMTGKSAGRVHSFSIGFHEAGLDEAKYAKAVAAHLGTTHVEWYIDEAEAMALVPELSAIYDEPLADSSQIPTLALARLVRRDVTVALSGDGADELFGGYPKYRQGRQLWKQRGRRALANLLGATDRFVGPAARAVLPRALETRLPWHSVAAAAALYAADSPSRLAASIGQVNRHAGAFVRGSQPVGADRATRDDPLSYLRGAMLDDARTYLPGDILVKVDRATMNASLESRSPFLDHRVIEFAASLPDDFLFDAKAGKRIVRDVLARYVPTSLTDRPKQGFCAPLGAWLRGGLRDWAYDLLGSAATDQILVGNKCVAMLDTHCRGHHDLSARLWPMISIAAWANRSAGMAAGKAQ